MEQLTPDPPSRSADDTIQTRFHDCATLQPQGHDTMKVAILDDYQNVALDMADWASVTRQAEVTVFTDTFSDPAAVIERLRPFDVVCVMRERTPLTRAILERLPNLKLIASTAPGNAAIDMGAAQDKGIEVCHTGYDATATVEFTWALLLATVRHIPSETASLRAGGWQRRVGTELRGKTMGLLGLGRIGSRIARLAQAFGMEVIAWSQNLTHERAEAAGARLVSRDDLLAQADVVSIHLVLSPRTHTLVDSAAFALMKPTAFLINTSRGPIVDEAALTQALREGRIAGAGIDVYAQEPLALDHPFRTLENLVATPHNGYVTQELYRTFYGDTVRNVAAWLDRRNMPEGTWLPSRSNTV